MTRPEELALYSVHELMEEVAARSPVHIAVLYGLPGDDEQRVWWAFTESAQLLDMVAVLTNTLAEKYREANALSDDDMEDEQ